ncbi:MAG: dTDP-4-dehydrorhamnose reductase [Candidatus Poriferisodalaceae bacterium]|jgi:dTDP-4-dehydrorhamnose reductase|tara:strand:+ start:2642 stop:3490 length:849 start_codon:yes stop_codon:yes gene_type:complete
MKNSPKILVTGGGGQLGQELERELYHEHLIVLPRNQLDITNYEDVDLAVKTHQPDVIINAGAFTAVDQCESEPDLAYAANALGPAHLVRAADRYRARVVQISTDYVFDGTQSRAYRETDKTNPSSEYGRSKEAGEQAMRPEDLIVRTSWLCGAHGSNLLKTVVSLASQGTPMTFVTDQIGHPSFTSDVASTIRDLVLKEANGTFHVTNQGIVSWYEFVKEILKALGKPTDLVTAIKTEELIPQRAALRPANSVLDNLALRVAGLPELPDFRESLPQVLGKIL